MSGTAQNIKYKYFMLIFVQCFQSFRRHKVVQKENLVSQYTRVDNYK